MQPTSQSWETESKKVPCDAGKRCAVCALRGRQGKGSSAVCVDRIVLLSANEVHSEGTVCATFVFKMGRLDLEEMACGATVC